MEENYIKELTETTSRSKHNENEILNLKQELREIKEDNKEMNRLITAVEIIANDLKHMKEDIISVKKGQEQLNEKVEEADKKSTFDWRIFVTNTLIPSLITAGAIYLILKLS